MADDDLLRPEEIETLLNTAGMGHAGAAGPSSALPVDASPLPESRAGTAPMVGPPKAAIVPGATATEQLLEQAEADLKAAVAPILNPAGGLPPDLGQPSPFGFPTLSPGQAPATNDSLALHALNEVELDLRVELGRTELLIEEVLRLREGSVVPLDKLAGDPVDILVNGRLIARGEVLVLNDSFCVRVAEILTPEG